MIGSNRTYDNTVPNKFIAELNENILVKYRKLSDETYDFIKGYKSLELMGFTEKAKEWSIIKYEGYDLSDIELN